MLLLHHSRNLTPAASVKGVSSRTSNFLQEFLYIWMEHTQNKAADLTSRPADGSRKTGWVLFSKQFLQFFSTSLLHNLAEWRCIMPLAHSRILLSIDVLCSLFFLQYPRVVCLRWIFSSAPKSGVNVVQNIGNYTKKKVGVGWSVFAFDKCLCHF